MGSVTEYRIEGDRQLKVEIYTDGAARGNPDGPGGFGTVLHYTDGKGQLHVKELSAGYRRTTNNRMELMAAIAGLEALNRPCQVELYSDSKYLVDAFNKHWLDGWIKKGWKRGKNEPVVATLTNLQITATGASFYCDGLMDRLHATVILADGTEVENRGGGGSRMEDGGWYVSFDWPVPLDVTDIVAIRFGDAEIPLN